MGKEGSFFTSDSVGQDIVREAFRRLRSGDVFDSLVWDGGETKKKGGGRDEMWE